MVIELLEKAGYTVNAARNGVEAVDAYRKYETSVDLLLLEIVMPRKSGPEALEEIRKLNPEVRAVICGGYGGDSETGDERGPALREPYDPQTLLARLRRQLWR